MDVYRHLMANDEDEEVIAVKDVPARGSGSKRALALKILCSPFNQAISIFNNASPAPARNLSLESNCDTVCVEKDSLDDSDWDLIRSTSSLRMIRSEPIDLSGSVTVDLTTSTHGGSYGDVWIGTWRTGKKVIVVCKNLSVNSFL